MKKNSRRGKTRVSKVYQWIQKFFVKFRPFNVFEGISRRDRRRAEREKRRQQLDNILIHGKHGSQFNRDKGRNKANLKARNRRNRKATRLLHQRERRQS